MIDELYEQLLATPSDMQFHLPKLRELAAGRRVCEMGTRHAVSTAALLAGRPKSLVCYDLEISDEAVEIATMAQEMDVPAMLHQVDLWNVQSILPVDFVLVDWTHSHRAAHHSLALALKAGASRMAFHDTEIFGRRSDDGTEPGIRDAFEEFIDWHGDWRVVHDEMRSFGLTVLEKL